MIVDGKGRMFEDRRKSKTDKRKENAKNNEEIKERRKANNKIKVTKKRNS